MADDIDLTEFFQPKARPCLVTRTIALLDEDEIPIINAALAREDISHLAIQRWLDKRGHRVTDTTVATHRTGRCSCERN